MRIAGCALLVSSLLAVSCGGPATAPVAPAVAEAPTLGTPEPSSEPAKPAEAVKPVESAKPTESQPPQPSADKESALEAAAKGEPDPNAIRDVTYVVVPEGLKISVTGVRFQVSASAVQVASGWGVKLSVVASVLDGKPHSLTSTKSGPLAFAGFVTRKGPGPGDHFGDERAGDGELALSAETPTKFNRTWPAKGVRVLGAGDSLQLEVALWGLGSDKDSRRPVKKFCQVTMTVDKGKPRAVVQPPTYPK